MKKTIKKIIKKRVAYAGIALAASCVPKPNTNKNNQGVGLASMGKVDDATLWKMSDKELKNLSNDCLGRNDEVAERAKQIATLKKIKRTNVDKLEQIDIEQLHALEKDDIEELPKDKREAIESMLARASTVKRINEVREDQIEGLPIAELQSLKQTDLDKLSHSKKQKVESILNKSTRGQSGYPKLFSEKTMAIDIGLGVGAIFLGFPFFSIGYLVNRSSPNKISTASWVIAGVLSASLFFGFFFPPLFIFSIIGIPWMFVNVGRLVANSVSGYKG